MQKINILIKSGEYYRIVTTKNAFTLQGTAVQIHRYNPVTEVLRLWYGEIPEGMNATNQNWSHLSDGELSQDLQKIDEEPLNFKLPNTYNLQHLLNDYDYRTALNVYYCGTLTNNQYPLENPFAKVKMNGRMPDDIARMLNIRRLPAFVRDEENPFYHYSDILLYFNGKRLERLYMGDMVKGYLLDECRFENNYGRLGDND